jgi:hypothetical protein
MDRNVLMKHEHGDMSPIRDGVPPPLNKKLQTLFVVLNDGTVTELPKVGDGIGIKVLVPGQGPVAVKLLKEREDGQAIYGEAVRWSQARLPGNKHGMLKGRMQGAVFVAESEQPDVSGLLENLPALESGPKGGARSDLHEAAEKGDLNAVRSGSGNSDSRISESFASQ